MAVWMALGAYWAGQAKEHVEPTFKSQAVDVITGVAGAAQDVAAATVDCAGRAAGVAAAAGTATAVVHRSPRKPGRHELHTPILPYAAQPLLVAVVHTVPQLVGTAELVICWEGEGDGGR